ncbi:hypothetical protein [Rathayibacter tritici]|uniref:hypothetical protein n=1 Tax=Rathayibacter tritici TaxID=33888 RepID=UPI000829514E|nr:hypothetical protein [Rathayibacter tritici]PPI47070.1 hypothetical protein C5D18_04560 [Rathayibacter tritici]
MNTDDAELHLNEASVLLHREYPKDGTTEEQQIQIAKAQAHALIGLGTSLRYLYLAIEGQGRDRRHPGTANPDDI